MHPSVEDFDDDLDHRKQREINLGTGTLFLIFFGAVLALGLAFGSGYTAGRHSLQTAAAATTSSSTDFSNFKPSPSSTAIQPVAGYYSAKDAAAANSGGSQQIYAPASSASNTSSTPVAQPVKAEVKPRQQEAEPTPAPAPVRANVPQPVPVQMPVAAPAPSPTAPALVQVAAVSHQEDADLLLSALRRRGYTVFQAASPSDRLIHVQLGPFPTRKDADAMRQRLLADGYNAIVK